MSKLVKHILITVFFITFILFLVSGKIRHAKIKTLCAERGGTLIDSKCLKVEVIEIKQLLEE